MASDDQITVTIETNEGKILVLKLDFVGDNGEVLTTEFTFDHAQLAAAVAAVVGDLLIKAAARSGLGAAAEEEGVGADNDSDLPF